MKRFIAIFTLLVALSFNAMADERPIEPTQLPKSAQEFIAKNFAGTPILSAFVDRDVMDTDYEVRLEDGTKIDFNGRGDWTDITNKRSGIPASIVPHKLTEYTSKHYNGAAILSIERNSHSYEVKLSNGIELIFSLSGKLLGYDD